jgi:hypothetical protein
MRELTRLRRNLRDLTESPACDLQALLDATDQFYEDLEIVERDLSSYNSLTEEMIQANLDQHTLSILKAMIPFMESRPILDALLTEHTFEYIEAQITLAKQDTEKRIKEMQEWQKVADHPF